MTNKTFAEVCGEPQWDYDNKGFDTLVGKKIVVNEFFFRKSTYAEDKQYAIIWITCDKKDYTTISGSGVILDQLAKIKEELPVECTVEKVKDYYTFK